MTPFRERNPVPIGGFGLLLMALLMFGAFNADRLPFIGSGETYRAAFVEAAGLKVGDEVRIAGIKVGEVEEISLVGTHVRVVMRMRPSTRLGEQTRAAIKIKTVLGQKYVAVEPAGSGELDREVEIPVERTTSPFTLEDAFGGLSRTIDEIDTDQLAKAFDTLTETFKDSPDDVQAALRGLSRLSRTVSSRDAELRQLLDHAAGVTTVLADRDDELVKLMADGDLLLRAVEQRRDVIHQLLVNTSALSRQLTALVQENRTALKPALDNLNRVVDVLQRNKASVEESIRLLGPFVRDLTNTIGNGRWFDVFISSLVPLPPAVELPPTPAPKAGSR